MVRILRALLRDEKAATAIEYGLILALIAVACVGAFRGFAGGLVGLWSYITNTPLNS